MVSKAISKKVRRNSGRVIVQDDEGYTIYWDDWNDWRDGFRQVDFDNTKISPEYLKHDTFYFLRKNYNKKNKHLLNRRKLRKAKQYEKSNNKLGRINCIY